MTNLKQKGIFIAVFLALLSMNAKATQDPEPFSPEREGQNRPTRIESLESPSIKNDRTQQSRQRGFFKRQFRGESTDASPPRSEPLSQVFTSPTRQIALLLPLSGKHADSAKAVREGFLAAYYENPQVGIHKPAIRVYDTLKGDNIHRTYQTAIQEGADLVVGPLAKDEVAQLSMLSQQELSIPILALNQSPAHKTSPKLIQFALAPEEEAAQIAFKAHLQGYQTASIIVPDNGWGKRIADAFQAQWQHLGGRVMRTVYVDPLQDQATAVRRLLGMDETPPREGGNKKLTLKSKDVDVILMAAPPELARQWKPLFDFYYAEAVPVFATSSIYTGTPDPKRDRDMNGVIFCDMPSLIKPELNASWLNAMRNDTEQGDDFVRMFALGADAYRLSQQLNRLTTNTKAHFAGATGELTLDDQYRIRRQLMCARFKDGKPVPFP